MEAAQQHVAKEAPPRDGKSARRAKRARLQSLDTVMSRRDMTVWTRARSSGRLCDRKFPGNFSRILADYQQNFVK